MYKPIELKLNSNNTDIVQKFNYYSVTLDESQNYEISLLILEG